MDRTVRDDERIIEEFEEMTKNTERVQRDTLKKILEESGNTEYIQKYLGPNESTTDPANFRACVPVITYKDVEPYIQRIIAGDNSLILTGTPITGLTTSSGTTQGRPKIYLYNDEVANFYLQLYLISFAFRNREIPIENGKALHIFYTSNKSESKRGLPMGVVSTNIFRTLRNQNRMSEMRFMPCSPPEVTFGHDFEQSSYCHLLSGLIHRDHIQLVYSNFAQNVVHAFRTFERVWEELCYDIRQGVLSSRINIPSVRAAMSKLVLVKPNPELADSIYNICVDLASRNWYGSISKLFPKAKYIYAIMTGSMQPYSEKLRHYAGDQLPLISGDYGASEAFIGVNLNPKSPPESTSFAVIPNSAYYEFIPTRQENSEFAKKDETISPSSPSVPLEPEPVGLTQVEVGQEYEIVVTNSAGLYRYKMGDVVKITGFHNSTPQVQFVCRSNVFLSINNDKTTDMEIQLVVGKASMLLADEKLEVVDFTSRVEHSTGHGHYVVIWEVDGEASDNILRECCNILDKSIGDTNYVASRKTNVIGALELQVVRGGTLQKIAAHYVGLGASFGQFKMPRCMVTTDDAVLQILSENIVWTCFSTAYT